MNKQQAPDVKTMFIWRQGASIAPTDTGRPEAIQVVAAGTGWMRVADSTAYPKRFEQGEIFPTEAAAISAQVRQAEYHLALRQRAVAWTEQRLAALEALQQRDVVATE